jgi:hypothetical protein
MRTKATLIGVTAFAVVTSVLGQLPGNGAAVTPDSHPGTRTLRIAIVQMQSANHDIDANLGKGYSLF